MNQFRWMLALAMCVLLTSAVQICTAATFHCPSGDVACLTNAILVANANGEVNVINLEAGVYTISTPYTSDPKGGTAFPDITGTLTIQGASATTTVIQRPPNAPEDFRLFLAHAGSDLTFRRVTIQGGEDPPCCGRGGGGILSAGRLTILDSILKNNDSYRGGAVYAFGVFRMHRSTVTENLADFTAGLRLSGDVHITESAIVYNYNYIADAGGVFLAGGTTRIDNSTIAYNETRGAGGGILNHGILTLVNTTIAHNVAMNTGGVHTHGPVSMTNTLMVHNRLRFPGSDDTPSDCHGPLTSNGHNLIGDPTGCTITLQPTDRTGDPGFDAFMDVAQPGRSHFPLLASSQAIDVGHDAACPATDQLGHPRVGPCDIGAIEFQSPREPPSLALHLNQSSFTPGQTLRVTLDLSNPGPILATDVYVGVILPNGVDTLFLTNLSPLEGSITTLENDPRTFARLSRHVSWPAGMRATQQDYFTHTFTGLEPHGTYHFLVGWTTPNSLEDGRIDDGDVLALAWAPFTFAPGSSEALYAKAQAIRARHASQ